MKLNDAVAASLKLDGRIDVIAFDDESAGFGLRLRRSMDRDGLAKGGSHTTTTWLPSQRCRKAKRGGGLTVCDGLARSQWM